MNLKLLVNFTIPATMRRAVARERDKEALQRPYWIISKLFIKILSIKNEDVFQNWRFLLFVYIYVFYYYIFILFLNIFFF